MRVHSASAITMWSLALSLASGLLADVSKAMTPRSEDIMTGVRNIESGPLADVTTGMTPGTDDLITGVRDSEFGLLADVTKAMTLKTDNTHTGVRASESGARQRDAAEPSDHPDLQPQFLNFTTESFSACCSQKANLTFVATEGIIRLISYGRNGTDSEMREPDAYNAEYEWDYDEDDENKVCTFTVVAPDRLVFRMRLEPMSPIGKLCGDVDQDNMTSPEESCVDPGLELNGLSGSFCHSLDVSVTDTVSPMRTLTSPCLASYFFTEVYSFTSSVTFRLVKWQVDGPFYLNISFVAVPEAERPRLELQYVTSSMGKLFASWFIPQPPPPSPAFPVTLKVVGTFT